jgi:predicted RNase H-like HicB family nuclease
MSESKKFRIKAEWDAKAELWVATSEDVAGLVIQGRSDDEVVEKLRLVIPALIEVGVEHEDQIEIHFLRRGAEKRTMSLPLAA